MYIPISSFELLMLFSSQPINCLSSIGSMFFFIRSSYSAYLFFYSSSFLRSFSFSPLPRFRMLFRTRYSVLFFAALLSSSWMVNKLDSEFGLIILTNYSHFYDLQEIVFIEFIK
jgi:hypothetical protein